MEIISTLTIVQHNATSTDGVTLPSTGTAYATSDGYPRYKGTLGNASAISNIPMSATSSTRYLLSTRIKGNYTEPTPTCQMASAQCNTLQTEWHSEHYLPYPFNQSTGFWSNWWDGSPLDFPHCNSSYTTWINGSIYADSSGCWVRGAKARLFYWPEEQVAQDNTTCPPETRVAPQALRTPAANADPVTTVMTFSETYYNCCTTTMTLTSPTIYLSMQDVEGRNANWGFGGGGPIPATIVAVDPTELFSNEIAPPLITNATLSSSATSVIANREWSKYTDLFGYAWEQHSRQFSGLGGPNAPLRSMPVNVADFGKPPPPLSY